MTILNGILFRKHNHNLFGSNDKTYREIVTDAKVGDYGSNHPPAKLPPSGGKPYVWDGMYDDPTISATPDWNTDPLIGSATFTARYDNLTYTVSLYLESSSGSRVWKKTSQLQMVVTCLQKQ